MRRSGINLGPGEKVKMHEKDHTGQEQKGSKSKTNKKNTNKRLTKLIESKDSIEN